MIFKNKGYIGPFEMIDKNDGKRKLAQFVEALSGHERIIGPIEGSTWHNYRLVSYSDGSPIFPMEPQNHLWYNNVYKEIGFEPLKKYYSERFTINQVKPYRKSNIVIIRYFKFNDLPNFYNISKVGFTNNFLYEPISYEEFEQLYVPQIKKISHDFILVAEINGKAVGFLFAFVYNGELILKTLATLPDYRTAGVGGRLINTALVKAKTMGINSAVSALTAEDNNSRKVSAKYGGHIFREYTLYILKRK
ncbi:MAG: GNAT family N-acetyltransferase [Defluviitaleaceae bacterium]|nr:GNAT family N-acetyltransferase [Defluviitaleaceae bacterium]